MISSGRADADHRGRIPRRARDADDGEDLRAKLHGDAAEFRQAMTSLAFTVPGADHPIVPGKCWAMRSSRRSEMVGRLLRKGSTSSAFRTRGCHRDRRASECRYRPRTSQITLAKAVAAFTKVGREPYMILGTIAVEFRFGLESEVEVENPLAESNAGFRQIGQPAEDPR